MARSPKKIRRRDIRKPDQFVTLTGESLRFLAQYRAACVAALALVLVALLGLWGWDSYRQRQNRLAARAYSRALGLYHGGNYMQAIDAFAHIKEYSASPYSRLSLLYQANSYMAVEDSAKAAAALQEFLRKESKDTFLRQLGLLTLAYLQERTGRCKEALGNFAAAEKTAGPFKDEALLGKARCSLQNQRLKDALNFYRQYLTSYPASERGTEIALRVQEIEGKTASGGK